MKVVAMSLESLLHGPPVQTMSICTHQIVVALYFSACLVMEHSASSTLVLDIAQVVEHSQAPSPTLQRSFVCAVLVNTSLANML